MNKYKECMLNLIETKEERKTRIITEFLNNMKKKKFQDKMINNILHGGAKKNDNNKHK